VLHVMEEDCVGIDRTSSVSQTLGYALLDRACFLADIITKPVIEADSVIGHGTKLALNLEGRTL
jgi:hypothetical protein